MKRFARIVGGMFLALILLITGTLIAVTHPQSPGPLPTTFPYIARDPTPMSQPTTRLAALPAHTDARNPFEVDLRHADVSALDLTSRLADLQWANFDSATIWPPKDKLPPAF